MMEIAGLSNVGKIVSRKRIRNFRKIISMGDIDMSKARCKHCGDIIESKHRHDWVCCSCYANTEDTTGIFLDGGNVYLRYGGNLDNFELTEPQNNEEE
jgi:hypothetical protein